jgi:hypothetical protein
MSEVSDSDEAKWERRESEGRGGETYERTWAKDSMLVRGDNWSKVRFRCR